MSLDPLVDGAIIGATVLAGVGLILTYSSIRGNRSTIEASMVENIYVTVKFGRVQRWYRLGDTS